MCPFPLCSNFSPDEIFLGSIKNDDMIQNLLVTELDHACGHSWGHRKAVEREKHSRSAFIHTIVRAAVEYTINPCQQ